MPTQWGNPGSVVAAQPPHCNPKHPKKSRILPSSFISASISSQPSSSSPSFHRLCRGGDNEKLTMAAAMNIPILFITNHSNRSFTITITSSISTSPKHLSAQKIPTNISAIFILITIIAVIATGRSASKAASTNRTEGDNQIHSPPAWQPQPRADQPPGAPEPWGRLPWPAALETSGGRRRGRSAPFSVCCGCRVRTTSRTKSA